MLEAALFTMVPNKGGRLELVAIALQDHDWESPEAIWHAWLITKSNFQGGWDSLGNPDVKLAPNRLPAVAANADGRLEIVVLGGALWHTWQRRPGSDWAGWHSLETPPVPGSLLGGSALARNEDGRLELFTKAGEGTLWHRWQIGPGLGPWHEWHSLGKPGNRGFATPGAPPALASNTDGRLELFVQADDGTLWHRWQTVPNGGWSVWSSLEAPDPGFSGEPVVVRNQDGRLELFTAAADGSVWHRWQTGPGRGPWNEWHWLGQVEITSSDMMAAGAHADGRLVLFALATTTEGHREVWQREQTAPNDGWSEWKSFGRPIDAFPGGGEFSEGLDSIELPILVLDSEERLRLWSLAPGLVGGQNTKFYTLEQTTPSGAEWRHGLHMFSPPPEPAYIPQPAGEAPA